MSGEGSKIANLLGMARTAEHATNTDEALSYYNRVLEEDPTVSEAWLGKGRAAGWSSNLRNVRVNETIVAFGHAIATANDDTKADTAAAATISLVQIVDAIDQMSRTHLAQFRGVDGVFANHVTTSAILLDTLTAGRAWGVGERSLYESEVRIAKGLLDEGMDPVFARSVQDQMDEAIERLRTIDPSYQPPSLAVETVAAAAERKASNDAVGYVVAFIMMIVLAFVAAANR